MYTLEHLEGMSKVKRILHALRVVSEAGKIDIGDTCHMTYTCKIGRTIG